MTTHFKIFLGIIALASIVLFVDYRYVLYRLNGTSRRVEKLLAGDTRPPNAVLPKNDKERVTFNEKTHTLTIQTPTKTIKEYAKNPDIQILKNGNTILTRHITGFENEWFIGFGYSDTGRVFLGDNIFHFGRLDIMGAISYTPDNRYASFKTYAGVGYIIWHNTSINLGVNPAVIITKTPDVAGFVSVRF